MKSNITIKKRPAPKGKSYVVKSSEIQILFEMMKIEISVHVDYYPRSISTIFECRYLMPHDFDNKYYVASTSTTFKRIFISVSTVNYEDKQEINLKVMDLLTTEFVQWLTKIISLPDNSTYLKSEMRFRIEIENNFIGTKIEPIF